MPRVVFDPSVLSIVVDLLLEAKSIAQSATQKIER
jgi:hypothetical protein